ncbi:MAG: helix-turn-helix domain-containing protein [Clostridiales bacterium]|nr:helix-turn-helix domain-containing protein [Clostridiales bacterium]
MIFSEKLKLIRKSKGLTQEELADKLDVSRQAVAKWESGQIYPDIGNLIQISNLFNVTVDYLVRDQECAVSCGPEMESDISSLIDFRLEANINTYAAYMNETDSTRLDSHDYTYSKGPYTYHDTYVGGEQFAGEEAVWLDGKIQYAMNYLGRVLDGRFSGDFLKEALRLADIKMPYRGPEYYQSGEFTYKCSVTGDFRWFQGYEEIYCNEIKVYECYFHGGILK